MLTVILESGLELNPILSFGFLIPSRTADVNKIARAQGHAPEPEPTRLGPILGLPGEEITSSADEEADRALQGVRNKLDPRLSVEYSVNKLIQDARSSVRELNRNFHRVGMMQVGCLKEGDV